MAGLSYTGLVTNIRNYTEVDSNVLTTDVLENIILNAQYRIFRDIPIDADRKIGTGNFTANTGTVTVPAGAVFVRAVQVYTATGSTRTGNNTYLQKKDLTFLEEYIAATTSTGSPKYYAMLDTGATGESSSNSGSIIVSPTPSDTFGYKIHYNAAPATLETGNITNYISMNFPNGLLYCCLAETYAYLKGPADMLQLYEQKYKEEAQKFALEQTGRRRRDDYTDGTIRTKIDSASP
jgi:hypothetical protein|tara:strand:+ start:55 stop:762 length:708 start_codon:yes stop_codon:yes gene_type:complete